MMRTGNCRIWAAGVLAWCLLTAPLMAATNTWLGHDRDWSRPTNWSSGQVPSDRDGMDVLIPAAARQQPVLGADARIDGLLTIEAGASLTLGGHDIRTGQARANARRGIHNQGLLDAGVAGSVLQIGRGGFVNSGTVQGHPSLLYTDHADSGKLIAGGAVLQNLTVRVHLWQNVVVADDLTVRGDVRLEHGVLSMRDRTLTVGGSLRIADRDSGTNIIFRMSGDKATLVFTGSDDSVLDNGVPADRSDWHHNVELQNLTVDKSSGRLIMRGGPVAVNGKLAVVDGGIDMQGQGAVWLNVGWVRSYERFKWVGARIGDTITPDHMPVIEPAPMPESVPGEVTIIKHFSGPDLPADVQLHNIASRADITTVPFTTMARLLVDDDLYLRTCPQPEPNGMDGQPVGAVVYNFHFDRPYDVARISWAQGMNPWVLMADTTGDGQFDQLLRMDMAANLTDFPGGGWTSRSWMHNRFWPAVRVYGVQMVDLTAKINIYDFQIFAVNPPEIAGHPQPTGPVLEVGPVVEVEPIPADDQILRGFHVEPWMLGLPEWIAMPQRPELAEFGAFRNFVNNVRAHGGNIVNLWPLTAWIDRGPGVYEMDVLWSSAFDQHSLDENILAKVAQAAQDEELLFFSMRRVFYPKPLAEFPPSPTRDVPAPFVPRERREYLNGIVREQVESGVDGVGIGFDEELFRGIVNPAAADAVTREAFADRFPGSDFPERLEDTLTFRRWVVFAYEQFADYLRDAADTARATRPDVMTKTPIHITLGGTLRNHRFGGGMGEDIIGHVAEIGFTRAYAYFTWNSLNFHVTPYTVKTAIGASQTRGVVSLHDCPWAPDPMVHPGFYRHFPPVYMRGAPVSAVMHGARMALFWRWQMHFFHGGYNEYGREGFEIIDTLGRWGVRESRTPRSIAVLRSRASEDWWQIRQLYNREGDPADNIRGYLHYKHIMEMLITEGYPFDVYYLDQPEDLQANLTDYDLLILPFAWSISDDAFDVVNRFARQGKSLLLYGKQGETDEWGNARPQPLFAPLVHQGRATLIEDDVTLVGHHRDYQQRLLATIDKMLGDRKVVDFVHGGNAVELVTLEQPDGGMLLGLINWTDRDVEVSAGLRRLDPARRYQVLRRDERDVRRIRLKGSEVMSAEDLRSFRVQLVPWQVQVLRVAAE